MESWDDKHFELSIPSLSQVVANTWDGEDEEDEVKESWEGEENEKKEEKPSIEVQPKPEKKPLAERIAAKERLKREEMAKRLQEEEDEISPEDKLRRQKEVDLNVALSTTFVEGNVENSEIDVPNFPTSKEEFNTFTETLSKRLTCLSSSIEYLNFVKNLSRKFCATMTSRDIIKIKKSIDNLYWEKQNLEKGDKAKKSKGKRKAKLRMEKDNRLKRQAKRLQKLEDEISAEEKLRRQMEADLNVALATTFAEGNVENFEIDNLNLPTSKEEFDTFTETLSKRLTSLSSSIEYPNFVENLSRNLCATMKSLDIRKIKNSLYNLYLEKLKLERGDKAKKRGKGKAKLRMERDQSWHLYAYTNDYDEFDDSM
ncbi:eukaryotic translation initiation factor 3 subunit J-like isoform X2 [Leptinotarsa decemlineata]|uniref:eukaryotic translation initiation factor 3 subunit J-like isoform X2 n=1 Tax=Leptinotarsa decemlineata TaxID=7539 RepID=UPI003D303E79